MPLSAWVRCFLNHNTPPSRKLCAIPAYSSIQTPPTQDESCSLADYQNLPKLAVGRVNEERCGQARTCYVHSSDIPYSYTYTYQHILQVIFGWETKKQRRYTWYSSKPRPLPVHFSAPKSAGGGPSTGHIYRDAQLSSKVGMPMRGDVFFSVCTVSNTSGLVHRFLTKLYPESNGVFHDLME